MRGFDCGLAAMEAVQTALYHQSREMLGALLAQQFEENNYSPAMHRLIERATRLCVSVGHDSQKLPHRDPRAS